LRLALIGAGAGPAVLATVSALVLVGVRRNVFGIGPTGSRSAIDLAVIGRAFLILILLFFGRHDFSTSYPSMEATDMPFAEAMM
jgi:integral membrane sensor domain MASE1